MPDWHSKKTDAVAKHLGSDLEKGLSEAAAASRLLQGRNELPRRSLRSPLQLLAGQFSDPMIVVLLVVAGIALLMGELVVLEAGNQVPAMVCR